MRWPRAPEWSIYAVIGISLIVAVVLSLNRRAERAVESQSVGFPIGPSTPFDPRVVAPSDARGAGAGTAFSIDKGGVWLTARHVVEGCPRIVIVTGPGRGVAARAVLDPASESALLFTAGGAPPLAIANDGELRRGDIAYQPGYPKGRPGEVASRLLRRETLVLPRRSEPVLAWAEVGHSPFLWGSLAGLSGAPVLNKSGRVVAVTVAQAPRRRRLYTTTPTSLIAFLKHERQSPPTPSVRPISPDAYHRTANDLRKALSVVQVACLSG